jgi:DNA mismatch repair ATPase MutS
VLGVAFVCRRIEERLAAVEELAADVGGCGGLLRGLLQTLPDVPRAVQRLMYAKASPPELHALLRAIKDTGDVFARAATLRGGLAQRARLLDWVLDPTGKHMGLVDEYLATLNKAAAWYVGFRGPTR